MWEENGSGLKRNDTISFPLNWNHLHNKRLTWITCPAKGGDTGTEMEENRIIGGKGPCMFSLEQWFSKCSPRTTVSTLLGNLLEMQILGPYPQTTESEILGPNNLFYHVFQRIVVPFKGWETLEYIGRMKIQDTCDPGDRKPIFPVSEEKLPKPETWPSGYQVLTSQVNSLLDGQKVGKNSLLQSPMWKAEKRKITLTGKKLAIHLNVRQSQAPAIS